MLSFYVLFLFHIFFLLIVLANTISRMNFEKKKYGLNRLVLDLVIFAGVGAGITGSILTIVNYLG